MIATLIAGTFFSQPSANIIDNFEDGPIRLNVSSGAPHVAAERTGSFLGGIGRIELWLRSPGFDLEATTRLLPNQTALSCSSEASVDADTILYYGHGPKGVLGQHDLNADWTTFSRIRIHFSGWDSIHNAHVVLWSRATNGPRNEATYYGGISFANLDPKWGHAEFELAQFAPLSNQGMFDLKDIDAAYIVISPRHSGDCVIDRIELVP